MKCPVCGNENRSMLCPNCGFDSSRDYERYPTFGPMGKVIAVSDLRERREEQEKIEEQLTPVEPTPPKPEPPVPDPPKKKNKLLPLLIAAAVVLMLGVWIGTGMGGGKPEPSEPGLTLSVLYEVLEHPDEKFAIRVKFDGESVSGSKVKWTTSDPAVVTVEDGMVTAVGEGSATITAEYAGEKATCGFGCMFLLHNPIEEQILPVLQNTEEPQEISDWKVVHSDISITVGEACPLQIVNSALEVADVEWTMSNDGIVDIQNLDFKLSPGLYVVGLRPGTVTLTTTYEGETFTCIVRVRE